MNVENCNFFACYRGVVRVCAKWRLQGKLFKFYLSTRGKSFFRTRKPVRVIEFHELLGVRITCFWITFPLIFYWRKSGHSKGYMLTRFSTCEGRVNKGWPVASKNHHACVCILCFSHFAKVYCVQKFVNAGVWHLLSYFGWQLEY